MPRPMPPTSSLFLLAEAREHPMHVGGLQLFSPPEGADVVDVRTRWDQAIEESIEQGTVAPLFQKRARRTIGSLGQWAWEIDRSFDIEYHVRRSALPSPGRIRELLALASRWHSTLLDRHRPLWELHLVEGLSDGRFATYFKSHHALVDGVSALRMLSRMLTDDPEDDQVPPFWAPRERSRKPRRRTPSTDVVRDALSFAGDAAGLGPAFARTLRRALQEQGGALSLSAPRTMLNVPITGARRFAAQSWPMSRIRQVGKAADATVNDVVLALCSGALRAYLASLDALPDSPLIAMVPVSLHGEHESSDGGGNAVAAVMCNLGTHLADPAERLVTVHRSMEDGKASMRGMSPMQILLMSAIGISPLGIYPLLKLDGKARPPFNLIISNVPGPRETLYWNGARLDGMYPLSIPLDGQALNITVTSYSHEIAFGLTGCRRSVPHLQRLLTYLDEELTALELAVGV